MTENYDDIIDVEWLGSPVREHMPLSMRAKIFMPFAALKGFDELLRQTEEESQKGFSKKPGAQTAQKK